MRDEQTSADVHDVSSFGLPPDCGPGGAGGACTNAMMLALTENPNPTWTELLERMRQILKEKRFTQGNSELPARLRKLCTLSRKRAVRRRDDVIMVIMALDVQCMEFLT